MHGGNGHGDRDSNAIVFGKAGGGAADVDADFSRRVTRAVIDRFARAANRGTHEERDGWRIRRIILSGRDGAVRPRRPGRDQLLATRCVRQPCRHAAEAGLELGRDLSSFKCFR